MLSSSDQKMSGKSPSMHPADRVFNYRQYPAFCGFLAVHRRPIDEVMHEFIHSLDKITNSAVLDRVKRYAIDNSDTFAQKAKITTDAKTTDPKDGKKLYIAFLKQAAKNGSDVAKAALLREATTIKKQGYDVVGLQYYTDIITADEHKEFYEHLNPKLSCRNNPNPIIILSIAGIIKMLCITTTADGYLKRSSSIQEAWAKDSEKCIPWLKHAAMRGEAESAYLLHTIYKNTNSGAHLVPEKDADKARKYLYLAIQHGSTDAIMSPLPDLPSSGYMQNGYWLDDPRFFVMRAAIEANARPALPWELLRTFEDIPNYSSVIYYAGTGLIPSPVIPKKETLRAAFNQLALSAVNTTSHFHLRLALEEENDSNVVALLDEKPRQHVIKIVEDRHKDVTQAICTSDTSFAPDAARIVADYECNFHFFANRKPRDKQQPPLPSPLPHVKST